MLKKSRIFIVMALPFLLSAAAFADRAQTFIGNTGGGPTWTRPLADGSGLTGQPGPMRYTAQEFKLRANTTCSIYSSQDFDGVIFLYRNSFNPNNQLVNFVAGDDDGPVGNSPPDLESSAIENVALTGSAQFGTTYILVTTGFNNAQFGAFQNFVQCDDTASEDPVQPIQGSCGIYNGVPPEKAICLQDRFLVMIDQISNHATDGVADPVHTGSTDTALFWFYGDRNWEVMVKVINGCALNNRFWVFAGALTNQRYRIVVTDTSNSTQRTYSNPLGVRADAVADTNAFPCS